MCRHKHILPLDLIPSGSQYLRDAVQLRFLEYVDLANHDYCLVCDYACY